MRHPLRALFATLALAALPALAQDTYKIDPVHSEVSFKIRHNALHGPLGYSHS